MKTSNLRRKLFALMMIGVLVVNMLLSAPQKAFAQTSAQANKPNIVFVLVDDMDADTINRDPEKYAPHIKKLLIDKGVTFPNFFVDVSLCCPSRTSILRGQYAHNTGVRNNLYNNLSPHGGFQKVHKDKLEKETIATSLQANNYRTALIGKYLNGYPDTARDDDTNIPDTYIPPGWTEWYSPMEKGKKNKEQGYGNPYSQYGYTLNQNGKLVKYGKNPEDYGTDVYTGFATDFIKRSARDNKPFFLYLAPYNIHAPYTPAPRDENLFQGVKAPTPDNFNEADVSTKPKFMQDLKQLDREKIECVDKNYRKRLRSLQSVDDTVKKLVDTLKESGQLDNTYIVFTADNGYKQGIHRVSLGKESAYEEDIRLNLFVRGPGIPEGKKLPQIVGNIDFFPTFTDMAGVQPPRFVDGRSFLPLLKGTTPENRKWRSAFLIEHIPNKKPNNNNANVAEDVVEDEDDLDNDLLQLAYEEQSQLADENQSQLADEDRSELKPCRTLLRKNVPHIPTYNAIRTRNYTYVEYETGAKELYDIKKDPYQLDNKVHTAEEALLQRLANRLNKLRTCKADSCRGIDEEEDESLTP